MEAEFNRENLEFILKDVKKEERKKMSLKIWWILEKNRIFGFQGLVHGLDVFFWKTKDETKDECEVVNSLLSVKKIMHI